jgi:hypothetical protein
VVFPRKIQVKNILGKNNLLLNAMFQSVNSVLFLVLLSCVQLLWMIRTIDASIQVVDLGRVYQSRPDKYFGLQMRNGLEYPARLQRIPDNLHLCGLQPWNVTIPHDGLPGEKRIGKVEKELFLFFGRFFCTDSLPSVFMLRFHSGSSREERCLYIC